MELPDWSQPTRFFFFFINIKPPTSPPNNNNNPKKTGFPAHPHSGFNTLTYVLKGKMRHRDSMGVKQVYGDGAAQFLTAGAGVLHEEMWEFDDNDGGGGGVVADFELFQLWINLPQSRKAMAPSIQLAGACTGSGSGSGVESKGPIPTVTLPSASPPPSPSPPSSSSSSSPAASAAAPAHVTVRVIMGEAVGLKSPIEPWTPMNVLHVTLEPGARWELPLPPSHSLTLYVRRGPLDVVVREGTAVRLRPYETAFFQVGEKGKEERAMA
jgi:quercetin 2,3-dioxygenase